MKINILLVATLALSGCVSSKPNLETRAPNQVSDIGKRSKNPFSYTGDCTALAETNNISGGRLLKRNLLHLPSDTSCLNTEFTGFESFEDGVLDSLPGLSFLKFKIVAKNNSPSTIEKVFSKLTELAILDLSFYSDLPIPVNTFSNQKYLNRLNLTVSNFGLLQATAGVSIFQNLSSLEELVLDDNGKKEVILGAKDFQGLSRLKKLNVKGIIQLDTDIGQAFPNLQVLELRHNVIGKEDKLISSLPRLTSLYINIYNEPLCQLDSPAGVNESCRKKIKSYYKAKYPNLSIYFVDGNDGSYKEL